MLKRSYNLIFLVIISSVNLVVSYPSFKSKIPNGHHVIDPCQNGGVWEGVGHKNKDGRGPLNPFGEDWGESRNWSVICPLDSDKDGKTNGEELGDPNCMWTDRNGFNVSLDNITHPGICEPMDSDACAKINKWLTCENREFMCNSTQTSDVRRLKLQLENIEVPAQETTYVCIAFDIPRDQPYDIIAAKPIIGNKNVIHHMVFYGCLQKDLMVKPNKLVHGCFMPNKTGCRSMIAAFGLWDPALDAFCLPPDVGVRIGPGGYEQLMIQYHWTNFDKTPGLTDSSGLEVFYTTRLRENNSGMLLFGQVQISIPPKMKNVTVSGGCRPFCSRQRMRGPIKVIESFHHMHNYGQSQRIEIFRNGSKLHTLSDEIDYDYNIPKFFRHYDEPVKILPGDYISTTCSFNSMKADRTIWFGPGTMEEMCFGFIRYYPLSNLPLDEGGCSEYGNVPLCKVHTKTPYNIDGCDVKSVLTFSGVNTSNSLLVDITKHCSKKDKCTEECMAVQSQMQKDPCFVNDIGLYVKYLLSYWREWDGKPIFKDLLKTSCLMHMGESRSGSPKISDTIHVTFVLSVVAFVAAVFL